MITFRNYFKRVTLVFLTMMVITSNIYLTGCLDKNEIEIFGFVVVLGLDLGDSNEVIASIQMLKPTNDPKRDSSGDMSEIAVYKCSGNTINNALYNLSNKLGIPLKFSNNKYILVGRKFAETGIQPVIDFSLRFNGIRPTNPIFVTKHTAYEFLETQEAGSYISPSVISNLIKRQKYLCKAPITTNMEFANNIKSESGISVCGILSMDRRLKKTHNNFVLSGSAVFRRDRLIGYMDEEETCGMEWIKGRVKIEDILIENKDKSKISLSITKTKSSFKPIIDGKYISFTVNIMAQSNIREVYENKSQNMDFNADPDLIDELSKTQNEIIGERVNMALNAAQNRLGVDVFGFGETVYRDYPDDWVNIKKRWDNVFPHLNIKVNVSSQIKQTGNLSNVITDEEGS